MYFFWQSFKGLTNIRNTCVPTRKDTWKSVKSWWKSWRGFDPSLFQWFPDSPNDRWIFRSEQIQKSISESAGINSTIRSYPYPVNRTLTNDPIYGGGNGLGENRYIETGFESIRMWRFPGWVFTTSSAFNQIPDRKIVLVGVV